MCRRADLQKSGRTDGLTNWKSDRLMWTDGLDAKTSDWTGWHVNRETRWPTNWLTVYLRRCRFSKTVINHKIRSYLSDKYGKSLILKRFGKLDPLSSFIIDCQGSHNKISFTIDHFAYHTIPALHVRAIYLWDKNILFVLINDCLERFLTGISVTLNIPVSLLDIFFHASHRIDQRMYAIPVSLFDAFPLMKSPIRETQTHSSQRAIAPVFRQMNIEGKINFLSQSI